MINPIHDSNGSGNLLALLRKQLQEEDTLALAEQNSQLVSVQQVSVQKVQNPTISNSGSNMMSRNFVQADMQESKYMKAHKASVTASTSIQNQQQSSMAGILGQMAVNTIVSI